MPETLALAAVSAFTGTFILFIILLTPALVPANRPYGVNIPLSSAHSPQLARAGKVFTRWALATSLPLIALATGAVLLGQPLGRLALLLLPLAQLGSAAIAVVKARRVVSELKEGGNWYAGIDTGKTFDIAVTRRVPLRLPTGWFLASLALILAWAVLLTLRYPHLPDPYPVHFNAADEADSWASKSVGTVFPGFFVGAGSLLLMWLCGWLMARQMNTSVSRGEVELASFSLAPPKDADLFTAALGIKAQDYLALRNRVVAQKSLLYMGRLTFLVVLGIASLDLAGVLGFSSWVKGVLLWGFLLAVGIFALIMVLSSARAARQLDAAVLALADAGAVDPAELELPDESQHIRFGIFYYNRDNPSFLVPKHLGVGLTPNWAHLASWLFGLVLLATFLGTGILIYLS